jgi:hypothetical protein
VPQQWTFDGLLRELADEKSYPRLHHIAWSNALPDDASGEDERLAYLFGLDIILDGVQALIDQTGHASER